MGRAGGGGDSEDRMPYGNFASQNHCMGMNHRREVSDRDMIARGEGPSGGSQKCRGGRPLALAGLGNASECPATIIALIN
jgi:hypothetical protein